MEEEKRRGRRKGYHNENPKSYKQDALKAAKELLYGPKVISEIQNAKSDAEIERIMTIARNMSR